MVKRLLLPPLESLLNQLITLDTQTQQRLTALNDHIIKVELQDIEQHFFVLLKQGKIQLSSESTDEADMTIRGTLVSLFKMGTNKPLDLYSSDVKIIGDMGVGQAIRDLLAQVDIDWEEGVARYTGDVIAHHLGQGIKKSRDWRQKTRGNLQQAGKEYLQEEIGLLPRREAFTEFAGQVNELRDAVERLSARVKKFQQQ